MTSRKEFLAAGSLLAVSPGLAGAAAPPPKTAKATAEPKLTFDFERARFEQILSKPAKHKQCFGSTHPTADVLEGMNNSIAAYDGFLKEGPGSMQAVAVLYHGAAITLALDDKAWDAFVTPFFRDKTLQEGLPADRLREIKQMKLGKGNPFLHSTTNDPDDVSVERLVSKGSSFFVCHNALIGFSYGAAHATKIDVAKVHERLLSSIVPGALLVPAGVMAIDACQEAKFTYIQSSL